MGVIKRKSKKSKNGYLYEVNFSYKVNGVTQRYWKRGFQTKKEATDHEALKKAELKEYGYIAGVCKKTFSEVYEEFMKVGSSKYQYNTIKSTRNKYEKDLKDSLGNIVITYFDYAMLQEYFNGIAHQSIATNKNIKKAINRVLSYAVKAGYIKNNPINMVDVKGIDTTRHIDELISFHDFSIIVDSLKEKDTFKNNTYAIALEIGYYTGLRISEVLALEKSDIDFENDFINVNKKLVYSGLKKEEFYATHQMKSKSSKSIIPLALPLKKELLKWFEINPYDIIVSDRNGMYTNPNTLSSDIKKVAREKKIDFHFHMLRHTFATNLVTSDVDLKTTQELMRHSNINTTISIYTHINDQHKKQVINDVFSMKCGENVANLENKIKNLN